MCRATPPGGHRTPRPSLPLRRLRHRDRSRLPGRRVRPGQYGPRITAWVSYLLYAQFVPEKRLAELMSDLFAVSITTATITAMGRRTARRFEPFLAHVADVIRTAVPVKHLDETGLRIARPYPLAPRAVHPILTVLRIGAGRAMSKRTSKASSSMTITPPASPQGRAPRRLQRPSPARTPALIDIEKEDWAKSMHRLLSAHTGYPLRP